MTGDGEVDKVVTRLKSSRLHLPFRIIAARNLPQPEPPTGSFHKSIVWNHEWNCVVLFRAEPRQSCSNQTPVINDFPHPSAATQTSSTATFECIRFCVLIRDYSWAWLGSEQHYKAYRNLMWNLINEVCPLPAGTILRQATRSFSRWSGAKYQELAVISHQSVETRFHHIYRQGFHWFTFPNDNTQCFMCGM